MQQTILAPDTADEALLTPQQALLTDDSEAILRFAVDALGAGMETALVTLTGIRGGAARAAGAKMAAIAALSLADAWSLPPPLKRWRQSPALKIAWCATARDRRGSILCSPAVAVSRCIFIACVARNRCWQC